MAFTRDELSTMLRNAKMAVKFQKVNGDERLMNCTLMQDLLPPTETLDFDADNEVKTKRAQSLETLRVWDIDISEWRSFRIDSVLETSII